MKFSQLGFGLVIFFLIVTILPSLYAEFNYGENQWVWGLILGGMPLSTYGLGVLWFATTTLDFALGWTLLLGGYLLNLTILYFIGFGIEKLYKKIRP